MLASLAIRDIVLIERANLAFAPGLNVLTGETGAGKSILLDALGLAIGSRGQGRTPVRLEAQAGSVSAAFDLPVSHPIRRLLADSGLEDSDVLILRRAVGADGRTRAFVNDQPIGVALAREIGGALLETHGLADDRGLFDASTHRPLLDAFGGHAPLADEVAQRYGALAAAKERHESLEKARAEAAGEVDYLRHAAQELALLAPEPGEEERLADERALLMNAGRLAEEAVAAAELIAGDNGAESTLASALRRLARMNEQGRRAAEAAERALDGAFTQLQEGRRELEALLGRLEVDPDKLERTEERLFALRAAARKYHAKPDALAALQAEFDAKLASVDADETEVAAAARAVAEAREAYLERARALSAARAKAAKRLEAAVVNELAPLKLGHARFRTALVSVAPEDAGSGGLERVGFEVTTVEGAPFGPLGRIASGGELARFALALKVALVEASSPAVLVFDEVDRGVGGAVADAVGERLQTLARTTQVLLVTHSPQVAARAAQHFRILRKGDRTEVTALEPEERVEEVARMLAGAAVTQEARAAARRLIAEAQGPANAVPTAKRKKARA